MVMEYLEGSDLSAVIEERGRLPVGEAVGHVLEACDAIAEAHSYGIVHRDLKPANLFLARQPDGSSRIKVLDFGISKAMMGSGSGIDHSLTRTSSLMGSPLYMSPEQMKSAKNVDPRTDIWALGVILYELLSGAPPFAAESIPELSAKILLEETAPMGAVRSDVPPELEAVMRKALAKDPDHRPPTIAEFALALLPFAPQHARNVERITKVLQVAGLSQSQYDPSISRASSVGATPPNAQTAAAWTDSGVKSPAKRGSPAIWVALGLAAAGAVGAGAFFLGSSSNETEDPSLGAPSRPESPAVTTEPEPRPAASEPPPTAVSAAEQQLADEPTAPPAAASEEAPLPPRPRPVIRKPVAKKAPSPPKPPATPPPEPAKKSPPDLSSFGSRK
jgi:serine/threonine-protein kinase